MDSKPKQEALSSEGFESPATVTQGVILDANAFEMAQGQTKRGLSPRHVQLMAIGGGIGTGLFVGVGGVLSKAGPGSLVIGYLIWGIFFIWPINLCVGEMMAYLPVRGSIFELAARFVDPALGFAMGWTYFYAGVMLVCVELSAIATIVAFWVPDVNAGAWVAMGLIACVLLNVVAVKFFGESEFVMASLKVLLLCGLVLITLITMCGGNPHHDAYGFRHWGKGQSFLSYHSEGALGKFLGVWKVCIYAGFTISGPDMVALSAGEIQNPRRTIPRVARLIFYRLVGFYAVGVFAVGIICSSRDTRLLGAIKPGETNAAASPWVIGIENLGIKGLPHLINFLVLMSGWSCGNAYLYSSSRTLYGLARDGQAPFIFTKCTKSSVPIYAVGVVSLLSCVTFLVSSNSAATVFSWFIDLTTTGLIAAYTFMQLVYLGWYGGRKAQGLSDQNLPYVAPFTPWSSYVSLTLGILALIFVGFDSFNPWSTQAFITNYFCLPYTGGLFIFWKFWKKTKIVDPNAADLASGKLEADEECKIWEEGGIEENYRQTLEHMPFWQRCWSRIW